MISVLPAVCLVAIASSFASAQTIDPDTVPIATRDVWCTSQIAQCPLICLQTPGNTAGTDANDCDPTTLDWDCVCSDGITPNVTEYSQTIPYFICTQYNTDCVASCGSDNTCAAACNQDHPCGAQDPKRYNITTTTSATGGAAASATNTGTTAVFSGFGSGATTTGSSGSSSTSASASSTGTSTSTHNAAAPTLNLAQLYGLVAVAGGIAVGFFAML